MTDIYVYPHLNINNVVLLNEILQISKYVKLYALPNDTLIRIKNGNVEFIGEYYILGI